MRREARVPDSTFGALLRRYRLGAGISQETLAERAGVSADGISALERGHRGRPYRETLDLLAAALSLTEEERQAFEAAAARPSSARRRTETSVKLRQPASPGSAHLPLALTRFVGRDVELEEIAAMLREHRMITLTGTGGIGKTQTALQVATALNEAGDVGVCFVGLAPIVKPSFIVTALASALGVQEVSTRPLLQTLVAYLKDKALLLILDNCEQVVAEAAIVAHALLSDCPGVRILATSREPLNAAGERVFRLPSLGVNDAVALFVDRARAADVHFTLSEKRAPIVREICRRVDSIPLAIVLAAARVSVLSLQELAKRLEDRFKILTGGERTALPRHQTMRATIDWSYDLLSAPEQRFLNRLSVFANVCTLAAATAVCAESDTSDADAMNLLSALIDKSLVLAEARGETLRYRLLETTRTYASEKLDDTDERDLVARRHLLYLRDHFAELWERRERSARRSELEAALKVELDDVRLALDGALARGEFVDGGKLLAKIGDWQVVGLEAEGATRYEAYLAALPEREFELRALLSGALASLVRAPNRAFELAARAVELARESGDSSFIARILARYTNPAMRAQRFDSAERALTQAEKLPGTSAHLRMTLLEMRARLTQFRGDLEAAARTYEQLLKEHRLLGNSRAEQAAALNLAELKHARGETLEAIAIVQRALSSARSGSDKVVLAVLLDNLAGYLVDVEDLADAFAAARESIGIHAAQEPDHVYVATAIEHLALLFALIGELARGARLEGYAAAAFERQGLVRGFTERKTYDRLTTLLSEGLPPHDLTRALEEGASLAPKAAIALALGTRSERPEQELSG